MRPMVARRLVPKLLAICLAAVLILPARPAAALRAVLRPSPSITTQGAPLDELDADWPVLSGDGRIMAFLSVPASSSDVRPAAIPQVWVMDRRTGATELVTRSASEERANSWSYRVAISGDGRVVAFTSLASNLAGRDANGMADIFLFDRLTGTTERISNGYSGGDADGWSDWPSLSQDGRYVAFASSASNLVLGDANSQVDVFLYDRLTRQTTLVSQTEGEDAPSGPAGWAAAVSGDGRLVAYLAQAGRSPAGRSGPYRLYVYNQFTQELDFVHPSAGLPGDDWEARSPSFAANGSRLAAIFWQNGSTRPPEGRLVVYDLQTQGMIFEQTIGAGPGSGILRAVRASLSADGRTVAVVSPGGIAGSQPGSGAAALGLFDVDSGEALAVPSGQATALASLRPGRTPALAADGRTVVLAASRPTRPGDTTRPPGKLEVLDLQDESPAVYHVAGRVTDQEGWPLASARLSLGRGPAVRTDRQGYFYLSGLTPGTYRLSISKEGYTFLPADSTLSVAGDLTGLAITAFPEQILEEARLDLGMPYSFYRGCESPYLGCGGPYHGFEAGYCTDLVLDAYSWGVDFHIQYALDRDARAHPGHFYRWGNARSSHDMWRYFHYTGQVLNHQEPYLPGDIVFFDWERDGMMDHVALISEVDQAGRPARLLDATGVIDSNPSGLAAELPWEGFHEDSVWGHARWSGSYGAIRDATPPSLEVLQIALDGPGVDLRLVDEQGREFNTHAAAGDQLAARNAPALPIPDLQHWDLHSGDVVSLLSPRATSRYFLLAVTAWQDSAYFLHIKSMEGGWTTRYAEPSRQFLQQGQVLRLAIMLAEENGKMVHQVVALD